MKILNHPLAVQSGFTFLIFIIPAAFSACSSGAAEPATSLPVSTQISPLDGMVLSNIPAGTFLMGSEEGGENEQPVHSVRLDAFWMDQTEVTNGMYALCVAAGACEPPRSGNSIYPNIYYGDAVYVNYPVVWVTWYRARDYCNWAGRRLPTEAEWEYAARGGLVGANYPWGDKNPSCKQANFGSSCVGGTSSVGSYPSNGYGLYDMAGNVWEWVADWYDEDYYSTSPAENPLGPESCGMAGARAIRGGAWDEREYFMRSYLRYGGDPGAADNDLGFRCALSP